MLFLIYGINVLMKFFILSFGMSGTDFYEHFIMMATGCSLHLYYLGQVV